jgi:arginine N-succinyltransferase
VDVSATLFPQNVRRYLGQVGPETEPVKRMLERIGFQYVSRIDPFDGGPHYEAKLEDVTLVRAHRRAKLHPEPLIRENEPEWLVGISRPEGRNRFRAIRCSARIDGEHVRIPLKARELLEGEPGERVQLIPFE